MINRPCDHWPIVLRSIRTNRDVEFHVAIFQEWHRWSMICWMHASQRNVKFPLLYAWYEFLMCDIKRDLYTSIPYHKLSYFLRAHPFTWSVTYFMNGPKEDAIKGRVWRNGRFDACRPKGHGFDSRSSRHVGTLGKFFCHSCLWRLGVKFWHSIRAVLVAPLSSRGLKRRYCINSLNEWMNYLNTGRRHPSLRHYLV